MNPIVQRVQGLTSSDATSTVIPDGKLQIISQALEYSKRYPPLLRVPSKTFDEI